MDIVAIDPSMLNQILNQQEAIKHLHQQVQELQDELKIEEKRFSDQWEILAACQAREAKLREALIKLNWAQGTQEVGEAWESAHEALASPQDDTALKEFRKKILMEVTKNFNNSICGASAKNVLYKMIDES